MNDTPLQKARDLILTLSTADDASLTIETLEVLSPEILKSELDSLYSTAIDSAARGDAEKISILLRIFDHFNDHSHDRMLLHYTAQAVANGAVHEDPEKMAEALTFISQAFTDADAIDKAEGKT